MMTIAAVTMSLATIAAMYLWRSSRTGANIATLAGMLIVTGSLVAQALGMNEWIGGAILWCGILTIMSATVFRLWNEGKIR